MEDTLKNIPLSNISSLFVENAGALESTNFNMADLERQFGFFSSQTTEDQQMYRSAGIVDNYDRANNVNMIRLYKQFLRDYKSIRKAFGNSAVRSNINVQREVVVKERELIQRTIRLMDNVPENGALNLLVFSAILACTVGLSTCALSLPAGALGVSTTIPETVAATSAIAAAPGTVYLVLKFMGMAVKRNDQTNSVLTSQRTTGVLSKQMLIGKLNNMLAKTDKKLQCILSRQLLETNTAILGAMHKYNEDTMEKLVNKVDEMQRGLEKDLIGTSNKYLTPSKAQTNPSTSFTRTTKPKDSSQQNGQEHQFLDPKDTKLKNWNSLTEEQKKQFNGARDAYAKTIEWLVANKNNKDSKEWKSKYNTALNQEKQVENLMKKFSK